MSICGHSQTNFDSLWGVWNEQASSDSAKMGAIHEIAWNMAFMDPDSAFKIAEVQEKWAKSIDWSIIVSDALNTKGATWYVRGDYEKALSYWEECLAVRVKLNDKPSMAASYNNMSNLCTALGKYEESIDYLNKCIVIDQELDNEAGMADSYNNLGIIYWKQGLITQAIDHILNSIQIKERLKNHRGLADSYTNLGGVYQEVGNYEKSLHYHNEALKHCEIVDDERTLATTYSNIGVAYEEMGQPEKAKKQHIKALAIRERMGDLWGIANCYNNLSVVSDDEEDWDQVIEYNLKSLEIKEQLEDKEGTAKSYANLGNVCFEQKTYKKGINYCLKGLEIATEINVLEERKLCFECLYKNYKALGQKAKAFDYFEKYISARDSLYDEDAVEQISQREAQFLYAKKTAEDSVTHLLETEKQLAIQEKDKAESDARESKQIMISISAAIGLILFAIFSIFMYNRFKVTKKQKTIIEGQKQEVEMQKMLVEEKNNEVRDSINYAKRLQDAILPTIDMVKAEFPDSFVLYRPKDIVAGDFYWMETVGSKTFIAVADCTGHGVPGALVSVVCSNALNRSVLEYDLMDAGKILDKTRELVVERFGKGTDDSATNDNIKDGMDIALCVIDKSDSGMNVEFAGAHNPLWILRSGIEDLEIIKADKQPVGAFSLAKPFTSTKVSLQKDDVFFMFSDGYVDQFGGVKSKKYKSSRFRAFLSEIRNEPCEKMNALLNSEFENWKADLEQLDDVCVIGIRV